MGTISAGELKILVPVGEVREESGGWKRRMGA